MLWDKRPGSQELPPELKDKTPEEIVAALAKAKELETQVATLTADKVKLENDFTAVKTDADATKARLAEIEVRMNQPQPKPKPNGEEQDPPTIWEDPQRFIQEQLRPTQDVAVISGIMSAKLFAQNGLSGRDRKIWSKYEKDIEKAMEGYAPIQRMAPNNWLMALTLVKGQHDVEIAKAESTNTDFFAEPVSHGSGPAAATAPEPDDDKLTEDEEVMIRGMHWDREGYLKQKKNMTLAQSSKGAYARFSTTAAK